MLQRRFARWTPPPAITRWMSRVHVFLYRLTNGRLGGKALGAPVLLLTTTGKKTGKQRTTPLLYLQDGEQWVVVASNSGRDEAPAWWGNLKANPRAQVQVQSRRATVTAQQASPEEKE